MAEALERVRSVQGEADIRELIVLGAEAALERAGQGEREREVREQAKRELVEWIERGPAPDLAAAAEVRRHGFSRPL